jgi:hypothetical protein
LRGDERAAYGRNRGGVLVGAVAAAATLDVTNLAGGVELDRAAFGQRVAQLRSGALDARSHPRFGQFELLGGLSL